MANSDSSKSATDRDHESYADDAKALRVLVVGSSGSVGESVLVSHPFVQDNVQRDFTITRSDGRPDSETITFPNNEQYKMTFTYGTVGAAINRPISQSRWIKQ